MNKKQQKMKYFDDEERELIESIESGEWRPLPKKEKERIEKTLVAAAENFIKKKRAINIRISEADLRKIKAQAVVCV